jgi:integrase
VSGRKKTLTRTFYGSKRDAEEALSRLVTEVSGGGHSAQDTTVGDLVDRWFELAKSDLSPSTAREYSRLIRTHIRPALGKVQLARLRASQLDTLYARLRDHGAANGEGLSAASVRQVHAVLRRALHQGVRWGWIVSNPAANATPPRIRRVEIQPPEPNDVARLISLADEVDPDFACLLRTAITTGARRGELCALRWRDVDLVAKTVTISRSIVEGDRGAISEKETKTHAARRIALDDMTAAALVAHWERALERARAAGVSLPDASYVFGRSPGAIEPCVPNDVTKDFIQLRKQVGLEGVRLHDLRHFAATRMLAAGVPVRTVSGRLGHANAATTLGVYAHFVDASDRDAAAILGGFVGAPPAAAEAGVSSVGTDRPSASGGVASQS